MGSRHEPNILELERAWGHPRICFANTHRLRSTNLGPGRRGGETGRICRSRNRPRLMERATGRLRICFANPHRLRSPIGDLARTGCGRSPRIHGDDGEDFVELAVPRSPALDGAGNGTSAYLLRKSAPAAVAYRRPCLLAINASRLFNARTLSGSSPGTLLKKAQ